MLLFFAFILLHYLHLILGHSQRLNIFLVVYCYCAIPTMSDQSVISLEYRGRVAVLTIDNDQKLNSLSQMQYYDLAQKMREIATRDDIFITVILAKGRYFSA
jgi:hypothetical protein